ncbi:von Hippel-Lindau disease tumor suppressor, beta/alpha domain-containing protein [Mycena galopus ATCC 62051]|nr:von Hippel-Lindau disease tumor suppressor, beta/alpha domain-containing protein [Mycena galopus ATCC 62051]
MYYEIKAEHFTVYNLGSQQASSAEHTQTVGWLSPSKHISQVQQPEIGEGLPELPPIPPDNVAALRSARSEISTSIMFMNHSRMEVTLYWINQDGNPIKYCAIGTGEAVYQPTFVSHPWMASSTTGIIAVFFPLRRPSKATIRMADELRQYPPEVESELRSHESIISTYVTFMNKTRQTVTINWINFEGNPVEYWTLRIGQQVQLRTFVSHPWVIRDSNSRTIAVFFPQPSASKAVICISMKI